MARRTPLRAAQPGRARCPGRLGSGALGGIRPQLRLTNLDKVLFPPARAGAVTSANWSATRRRSPGRAPLSHAPGAEHAPVPGGADTKGFWHKQLPDHAPEWLPRWRDHTPAGQDHDLLVVDEPAALVWAANFVPWNGTPGRARRQPDRPTYALIDIDRDRDLMDEVLVLARLHAPPWSTWGARAAKLTGGAGSISGSHRPGPPRGDPDWWSSCPASARSCRTGELEVGRTRARRAARLDYTQNTSNKTWSRPTARARGGCPGVRAHRVGRAGRSVAAPDAFTIRTSGRLARMETRSAPCWTGPGASPIS